MRSSSLSRSEYETLYLTNKERHLLPSKAITVENTKGDQKVKDEIILALVLLAF